MILPIIFFLKQLQVTSNQQSLIKYQSLTMSCELLFWYNYTVGVKNKLYWIYFTSNELYLTFPFKGFFYIGLICKFIPVKLPNF